MSIVENLKHVSDEINASSAPELDDFSARFVEIVNGNIHIALANGIMSRLLEGEHTALPSTNGKYILLFHDRRVSLAVVRYQRPTRDVLWSSENFMQQCIVKRSCSYVCYAAPGGVREDIFDPAAALAPTAARTATIGTLIRKAPDHALDVRDLDDGPMDFVRLSLPPQGSFEWAFSRDTLQATSITTTRYGESNLLGILDLMAQAGNDRSRDLMVRLLDHPLHFVRWKAIRSLVQLDPAGSVIFLENALADAHPEVRQAAARSLALVNQASLSTLAGVAA